MATVTQNGETQTQQPRASEAPVEVEVVGGNALALIQKAEIDIAISTAKAFPRSVGKFREEAETLATLDLDTAKSCRYTLPRDGKIIEGPSIRLMEICAYAWCNSNSGARIVDIGRDFVTAQGVAHDLEKNTRCASECTRRILKKDGTRYGTDMIQTTCAAAMAIARRNALLGIIPRVYVNQILSKCKAVIAGDLRTLKDRIKSAVDYWEKQGVTPERLCAAFGKPTVEDLSVDDFVDLEGFLTAIKDKTATIESLFPLPDEPEENRQTGQRTQVAADALKEKAKKSTKDKLKEEPKAATNTEPQPEPEKPATEPNADGQFAERLKRANQLLVDLTLASQTWRAQMKRKYGREKFEELTVEEQNEELDRLEKQLPK